MGRAAYISWYLLLQMCLSSTSTFLHRASTGSWSETFEKLCMYIRAEVPTSAMIILAGDINVEKLGATAARDLPATMVSAEAEELPCVEAVLHILTERRLRIAVPQGGFGPTHFPYNTRAPARCLDYFIVSNSLHSKISEVHRATEVCTASSHIPLSMRLTWDAEKHDPKKHFVRRKWPRWRPASEGQLSDLLDPNSWDSMEKVEQEISRAGRVGALRR